MSEFAFTTQPIFAHLTAKQRAILDAAITVFAAKGYANSSTHEIAVKAGVAEGNIFSKFGSKAGLLQAIIDPVVDTIFPATVSQFTDTQLSRSYGSLADFLNTLVRDRLHFLTTNGPVVKVFLSEVVYSQTVRDRLLANLPASYWATVNRELGQLRAAGELVPWSDREVLRLIWSLVGGTLISHLYFNQPLDESNVDHLITALTAALTPKQP